jgi:hypothetical protein
MLNASALLFPSLPVSSLPGPITRCWIWSQGMSWSTSIHKHDDRLLFVWLEGGTVDSWA